MVLCYICMLSCQYNNFSLHAGIDCIYYHGVLTNCFHLEGENLCVLETKPSQCSSDYFVSYPVIFPYIGHIL